MDGQANVSTGDASFSAADTEDIESGAAGSSGVSEAELGHVEGNLEHLRILDEDLEQPDGQRSSLSLDEDGGTHFESYSQETVVRRVGPIRDINSGSPTQQEESDDNDVAFNPAQRLKFDDDDDDDDNNNDNETGLEVGDEVDSNGAVGDREYMFHRPYVNGSDMTEQMANGGMLTAHDQGQNVRIIEGHDSSLLEDGGNSAFGFNFLQTQMVQFPLMSPVNMNSGLGNSRMEDEVHNLYDSLEREDGSSLYGEADERLLENSSSEYFSTGGMSLVVANSQLPDCDSLWAQDDSPDHGSYLPHSQQHFHNGHGTERNRRQSPPRNFQGDASDISAPKRRNGGFVGEGHMGGYGDVHDIEEDNTDALTLELSEEGLSHTSQPLSENSTLTITTSVGCGGVRGDVGALPHRSQNDRTSSRPPMHCNVQMCSFDNATTKLVHQGVNNSQPKNLPWGQGLPRDESKASSHVEGDGVDTQSGERQAGAGSLSTTDQKLTSDTNQSARRLVFGKTQTRRPAVQGSASSGDNKRSVAGNPRQGSVPSRKAIPPAKSGSHSDTVMRGSNSFSKQNTREQIKGSSGVASDAGYIHAVAPEGQTSAISMVSRSSSHTSLASNSSSTNNRIGGVGKESQMVTNTQAASTQGAQFVRTELNNHNTLENRPDGGKGDTSQPLLQATHSGTGVPQANQHPHGQLSYSYDQTRQVVGPHSEPHIPQFFTKHRSAGFHQQYMSTHGDNVNEFISYRIGDPHGSPSHDSSQVYHNVGAVLCSGRNPQNQIQQNSAYPPHAAPSQHQSYSYQVSHQSFQTGFPAQATHAQSGSPPDSQDSHHSSREALVSQMKAVRRQGTTEAGFNRGHLDNDIQGMEEVRSHLHSMLHMGNETPVIGHHSDTHSNPPSDLLLSEQPLKSLLYFDADTSSFMGNSHQDDMSDIFENFPTFSSKIFSDMTGVSNKNDTKNLGENQYLRDSLEKEKYRRKHCEEHIQKQNAKLLEVQQQLAVAVSTDKRKDIMIEQLDKQLAKVVEGWKKREAEKDEYLKILSQEKAQIEESLQSQQNMINSFERELSRAVEELREEREKSAQTINTLKEEVCEIQRQKEHLAETLTSERDKYETMTVDWDNLKASKELAERRAEHNQERLIQEQENWSKQEQELLARINEVQESNLKLINVEKVKLEEQKKRREDAETESEELKTELKKAILDMEQLIREKETQKVEMAIMEAKFENAQRKLEADLHAQMEKEIADQAAEFHSRIEASLEEAANRHHKQLAELHNRHQHDMERQATTLNEERQKKEEEYRRQLNELEEKLQEMRNENMSLRQSKIKLESQRMEILTKLQFMMQSQWNEAVSLLVTTPQKKSLNSSFMSSQSGGQLASAVAVTDSSNSVTGLNFVTSGPSAMMNQENESQDNRSTDSMQQPSAVSSAVLEHRKVEGHEEINRMDRIEEYLQRLPHHMDIPVMRNEPRSSILNQGSHSDVTLATSPNSGAGHTFSSAAVQQQHQQQRSSAPGPVSVQEFCGDDYRKPSNNLNQTRAYGFMTGPGGKTLVTASAHAADHIARSEPRYQAVPMRSPQQSSSRHSSDSSHRSGKSVTDISSVPTGHQHLISSHSGQGFVPLPQHQRYHTGHAHQEQKLQSSPQQPQPQHLPHVSSGNHSRMRPLTGDFGDHKEMKLISGSTVNINLYRSESPAYISSPASLTANHWSPSSDIAVRRYPSVPSLTSGLASSSGCSVAGRPLYNMESPVKRQRQKVQQPARHIDELKESLSPPVKQKAEKEQSDSTSDASSGCLDPDRLQGNYNHIPDQVEEHMTRQGELQHYVRMLLQKAPGSVCSEPERDLQFSDHDLLESSQDITDFDLNDTATAAELTAQLTQLQHQRERQTSRIVQNRNPRMQQQTPSASQSNESILSHLSELFDDTGVISSQRLSEISKLLSMYRDPVISGQASAATQLQNVQKDAVGSSSVEHVSKKDDKRSQGIKNSPKSQQSSKVRDLAKTHRIRSESQSADSSLVGNAYSLEKSASCKLGAHGVARKGHPPTDTSKDRKTGVGRPSGGRNSGGPAWK